MGTRTIESKEIGKFNIDNDLVYVVNQGDFGYVSDDDTISVATNTDVGGIKLYTSDEAPNGIINDTAKTYSVQIYSQDNPKAFVHVPWTDTIYTAKQKDGFVDPDNKGYDICLSNCSFFIDHINARKITGAGDLLMSSFNPVSSNISEPIYKKISSEVSSLQESILSVEKNICLSVQSMSVDVQNICSDISNQIIVLSSSISADIITISSSISTEIYELCTNQNRAPSYFKDNSYSNVEVDSLLEALSNTADTNFMKKYVSYLCSETSSKLELDEMFNAKQNSLSVTTVIDEHLSTELDVPTVEAVRKFVNSSIQQEAATFRGSYDSLNDVPLIGTSYVGGKPDNNDYMFVDLSTDRSGAWNESLSSLEDGTWRFKYVCSNHIVGDDPCECWDKTGISGWHEEFLVNDTIFTNAQKEALNSGINSVKVKQILDYNTIKAKLTTDYPSIKAKHGALSELDAIPDNITGSGTAGKIAVFVGQNAIKSDDNISPKVETWQFTTVTGATYTKKIVVSD